MRFTKNTTLCAMLCVCSLLGGAGCIGPQDDSEVVDDLMSKTPAISPELWSPSTSEEDSPAVCGTNPVTLVGGVECDGSYCDNIGLHCTGAYEMVGEVIMPTLMSLGASTWSGWFSEEGSGSGQNSRQCSGNTWMTGIKCRGSYCDEISIRCSEVFDKWGSPLVPSSCGWSSWHSEEDPPFSAGSYQFLRGVKCQGSNCDEMAYYVCLH